MNTVKTKSKHPWLGSNENVQLHHEFILCQFVLKGRILSLFFRKLACRHLTVQENNKDHVTQRNRDKSKSGSLKDLIYH